MTDEGLTGTPIDAVELVNGMKGLAAGVRAFYDGLVEEGFGKSDALKLTIAYVTALASQRSDSSS